MAEAIVSSVVETIGNLLVQEAELLHGVSDQVERLQLELNRMRAFLRDADARQHDTEIIKEWIPQARGLAYEANDLIERYAFKVEPRRRKGIRSILRRCVCILNECYNSHTIGTEIQTLMAKISDLTKSFREYGIREMMEREGGPSLSIQELRRIYSHVIEDDFVGLDSDVELLVDHLVTENETYHSRVVSIYGMGGLGKSTLAIKVYNHSRVKRYFDGFALVSISQKWQKEDILQQILIKLIPEKRDEIMKWRDDELVKQLFQIQQNKKYLVVLDDIWSADAWKCIRQAFPIRKDGTKILLTTRNKDVALQIDPNGFHHQPPLLSDDESWELLQMKALRKRCQGDHKETQKFEMLGKEMAIACRGLPLAVVVLGGILATKKSSNDWEAVCKNIKAYPGRGNNLIQEEGNIHKILALSYNDLPRKLKPCFLYLGRFAEDSRIDAATLYQLWIAEGLISTKDQNDGKIMMDVAERYLGELVQRCMVQATAPQMPSILKSFGWCWLHDLMRDLSLHKAEEESFMLSKSYVEIANNSSLTHSQIYRLVIRLSGERVIKDIPLGKRISRHLRSLALVQDRHEAGAMKFQFNQFKMLRVLDIEGLGPDNLPACREVISQVEYHSEVPEAIGKFIHLRYLRLKDLILPCLPSSIGNLYHLETLDLRYAHVLRIPNVLWKLKQLRHLYLPEYYDSPELGNLNNRFSNLRLDGLDNLEILENFCSPTCHIKDISKLKNLLAFSADLYVESGDPMEIIEYISKSGHLRRTSLKLRSKCLEKLSTVVAQCFSCPNLQRLRVYGHIGNLPNYEANSCTALIELRLSGSMTSEDPMKTLEMLPNLRSLELFSDSFVGKEMRCTGLGFRQLTNLYLYRLPNLEKWWVDDGAMPNLFRLVISKCENLGMIPVGLGSITTLQELRIKNMPREFTERIEVVDGREGTDFHKVSHIPSIMIK